MDEDFAPRLLSENEGKRLGDSIRRVELATNDPRFERIGELQRETRAKTDRSFFYGWHIRRRYTKEELVSAKCLQLAVTAVFEPAGEECGTEYDEATACSNCGAGAAQVSDLYLDLRKAPKNRDIARTIADEIIVSQRLAEKMIDAGVTGFQFRPVRHKARYEDEPVDLHQVPTGREILRRAEEAGFPHPTGKFYVWLNRAENRVLFEQARAENATLKGEEDRRKGKPMPIWYQLVVTATDAEIVPPTRVGIDPFDDDPKGECRCPLGDLIGLNLLSEVSIRAASRGDTDIVASRQFIGTRRGVLRPRRAILISPRMWRLIESEKLRGIQIEVAHLA
ncbi:MAG: hypothetical protein JSW27_09820 [Phycisphaerales bacterium]|nr:MAG: hypothetical protein JSW27_09820 [Phycisphaerales bacterium]